jgi:hypothetical protein
MKRRDDVNILIFRHVPRHPPERARDVYQGTLGIVNGHGEDGIPALPTAVRAVPVRRPLCDNPRTRV